MRKALIVGGNSGIGLAAALRLLDRKYDHVYIVGKEEPKLRDVDERYWTDFSKKVSFEKTNFANENYGFLDRISDIDTLIITAGFGRVAALEDLQETEVRNLIKVNMQSCIQVLRHYYHKIKSETPFYCAVMGSIAGHVASPLFSVYGATKAGLCAFIENVNIELAHDGYRNRILDVSPGSLKGTNFDGAGNRLEQVYPVVDTMLEKMFASEMRYIPDYETVYRNVIDRYHADAVKFGIESYDYKIPRITNKPQVVVGYLSGTFDLFHIGHLNLLRRAKEHCDYLVVGVHRSGAWKGKETYISFEERAEIVRNIRYVDRVIESYPEDCDAWNELHYDKLFVGGDYKGSERFNRYEAFFADKDVEIVYFPYTQSTSSTQLRNAISGK